MAKKPNLAALTFRDLVLGADVDTLRQALEARSRIDELIAERQAAYERIAALEAQVEEVLGEPGVFPFPAPPLPVAGIEGKGEPLTRSAGGAAPAKRGPGRPAAPAAEEPSENDDAPAASETHEA